MLRYFVTWVSAAALCAAVFLRRGWKVRMALAMAAASVVGLLLERLPLPHYFAPAAGLVFVLIVLGVQWMRVRWGMSALVMFTALFFTTAGFHIARESNPYANPQFAARRLGVIHKLKGAGGRHLVVVRYLPGHNPLEEWVYNHADIDGSAVVWARDMGGSANAELLDYYRGRQPDRRVWVLDGDAADPEPTPYGTR